MTTLRHRGKSTKSAERPAHHYLISHFSLLLAAQPPPCALHATCSDTADSFLCTCDDGYEDGGLGGCQDVNECAAVPGPCSAHASCVNTDGSFNCTCNPSFTGDGFSCLKNECAMTTLRDCDGQELDEATCNLIFGTTCQGVITYYPADAVCSYSFNCQQLGCDQGDCTTDCPSVPSAFVLPREYSSCSFFVTYR